MVRLAGKKDRAMTPWRRILRALFGPRRAPRRRRCGCGGPAYHPWKVHNRDGCKYCRLEARGPCRLNRNGNPIRAVVVVKESA